jgi:hypothetical protein
MTCDGCESQFYPGKVRHVPASLPRRLFGAALLSFSGLMFMTSVYESQTIVKLRRSEVAPMLLSLFLLPVLGLIAGSALVTGRLVVDEPPPWDEDIEPT